jgi:hypothetical protein
MAVRRQSTDWTEPYPAHYVSVYHSVTGMSIPTCYRPSSQTLADVRYACVRDHRSEAGFVGRGLSPVGSGSAYSPEPVSRINVGYPGGPSRRRMAASVYSDSTGTVALRSRTGVDLRWLSSQYGSSPVIDRLLRECESRRVRALF